MKVHPYGWDSWAKGMGVKQVERGAVTGLGWRASTYACVWKVDAALYGRALSPATNAPHMPCVMLALGVQRSYGAWRSSLY